MGEMLTSNTEFVSEKKKKPEPPKGKKSDITKLVEGEITRDQERWRQSVTDAASTGSKPPEAVIARLGIAWGITDSGEASRAFAEDMKGVRNHRKATQAAESNTKQKAAWLQEHGTKKDLQEQRDSLEESLLQVKRYLTEYYRLEGTGVHTRARGIEVSCKRMWPTETQTHS